MYFNKMESEEIITNKKRKFITSSFLNYLEK